MKRINKEYIDVMTDMEMQEIKVKNTARNIVNAEPAPAELKQAARRALLKNKKRLTWDQYFIAIADAVAARSSCSRRQVGAIITKDKRIISTGYNGTPRGVKNCNEGGCPRCASDVPSGTSLAECLCCHAEENAIVQSAHHGVNIQGATLYTTFSPCLICTKMILNSGITEVVFKENYSIDDTSMRLLNDAEIKIRQL